MGGDDEAGRVDIVAWAGKLRSECLRRVLSLTEHENADIRRRAIQNAVVKR